MREFCAPLEESRLAQLGQLELAYAGDAVYELLARTRLTAQGGGRVGALHREAVAYVSAPAQAAALEALQAHLTEDEAQLVRRGRNAHVHGCPAGCTPAQYHAATALEALFGWLWLSGRGERCAELFDIISEQTHAA